MPRIAYRSGMQLSYQAVSWASSTASRPGVDGSRSVGVRSLPTSDGSSAPPSAATVRARSTCVPSASVVVPGVVTPGTRTYSGTRMISSYTNGPLLRRPWEPHMSPWSDVKTTARVVGAPRLVEGVEDGAEVL